MNRLRMRRRSAPGCALPGASGGRAVDLEERDYVRAQEEARSGRGYAGREAGVDLEEGDFLRPQEAGGRDGRAGRAAGLDLEERDQSRPQEEAGRSIRAR